MKSEGLVKKNGFFTTRYVEAENPEEAELRAVQLIREDQLITASVKNDQSDPPMIYFDSLAALESFDGVSLRGTGYSFFPDD